MLKDEREKRIDYLETKFKDANAKSAGTGDITDLLEAGHHRDILHREQESERTEAIQKMTATVRTFTIIIALLTAVTAWSVIKPFVCHDHQAAQIAQPSERVVLPPIPRDLWH